MRSLLFAVALVACSVTKTAHDGEKVTVGAEDHVIVGSLRIDVESRDDGLALRIHDGVRPDDVRLVSGNRLVKFGGYRVKFVENGSSVTIVVRAHAQSSPISSGDAILAADEAMAATNTVGMVECTNAILSEDGAAFIVHCHDTGTTGSDHAVNVNVVDGAILSL